MSEFHEFVEYIKKYEHIALTAPAGADGDSVGTQCSLKEVILFLFPHKKVRIINEDECPIRYRLLPGTSSFEKSSDVVKNPQSTWPQVMICVDGGFQRIGDDTTKIWNHCLLRGQVDHHSSAIGDKYDFRLFDPVASSTTVLVYRLAKELNVKFTKEMAQAIYTGMIFDTGLFKHSNTTPETLLIASDLMKYGFNHTETVEKTMLIRNMGALNFLKLALSRMQFEVEKQYVWSFLRYEDIKEAKALAEDREGIIDFLFLTPDCQIAALYFEIEPNKWKISFRSRDFDVAKMAQDITPHGGGHKKASGCTLLGNQDLVLNKCHEAVKKTLAQNH